MNMNLTKRILSLVLTLALLISSVPATAFATEDVAEETVAEIVAETAAPTEAATEPAKETVAPTQPAVPKETVASTEAATEPEEETIPAEDMAIDASAGVIASGQCGENLTWTLDEAGKLIISGTGFMTSCPWNKTRIKSVEIGNDVFSIVDYAFENCTNLTNVTIGELMAHIGRGVFINCHGLLAIDLPGSLVTIGQAAFQGCTGLTTIEIPESTSYVSEDAFDFCINLKEITVATGNSTYSAIDGVLLDAAKEKIVLYPRGKTDATYTVPAGVKIIGINAFRGCGNLTAVKLSASVDEIEKSAFQGCNNLTSITLPEWFGRISNYAFSECQNLKEITFIGDAPEFCKDAGEKASHFKGVTATAYYPTSNISWTANVMQNYGGTITWVPYTPDGSENIIASGSCGPKLKWKLNEDGALTIYGSGEMTLAPWMERRNSICSVVVEDGATSICDFAFQSCSKLENAKLADTVTSIGEGAFQESGLRKITIPNSVTHLGDYAFSECEKLKSVVLPEGIIRISEGLFKSCHGLTNITIPRSVTTIGDYAFYYCDYLKSISIPAGVTSTGNYTFYMCSYLSDVKIPDSVTSIGNYAFYGCHMNSIKIPNSVTNVGESAFEDCTDLTSITLSNNLTSIGSRAFSNCQYLQSVKIPDSVTSVGRGAFCNCINLTKVTFGSGLTHIGKYMFSDCEGMESIQIPGSVTSIGVGAFSSCDNLTSVTIDSGVVSIGDSAFSGCRKLQKIKIPDTVTDIGYSAFKTVGLKDVYITDLKAWWNITFADEYANPTWNKACLHILNAKGQEQKQIVLDDSVTEIPANAFRNCTEIWRIVIPDSVTIIGDSAFENCTDLTSIEIPDGVTDIGASAFYGCSALKEIVLPDGLTSIGATTFKLCKILESIKIPSSVTRIGTDAFGNCYSLVSIKIPDGVTSLGDSVFYSCKNLKRVELPDSVTSLADSVFMGCSSLTSIKIPDSVTSIGDSAFTGCSSLTSIKIPDGVTSLGNSAFSGCENLKSAIIGNGLTHILSYTFYQCRSLSNVEMPANIASIGAYAFNVCQNLKDITIGSNVTSIGSYAFSVCSGLTSIVIPDSVTSMGEGAFDRCKSLESVTIGTGMSSISSATFIGCTSLVSVEIPDNVTSIGDLAFSGCGSLASIAIPDSVTSIGEGAFYGCGGLESVTIGSGVTSIGAGAFELCRKLNDVYIMMDPSAWCKVALGDIDSIRGNHLHILDAEGNEVTEFELDRSITEIPAYVFRNFDSITSIAIPDSVNRIGDYAFSGCTGLIDLDLPASVTSIGNYAFSGCSGLISIDFLAGRTAINEGMFMNCTGLKSVVIPDNVTSIGYKAFTGCSGLTSIVIPDSVVEIGAIAFRDCRSLESIVIPDGVTSIAYNMFTGCESLRSVEIPDSVTSIGVSAFLHCSSLTSIKIPGGVTCINSSTFGYCTNLTSIVIPNGVTSIREWAFEDCKNLVDIYYGGTSTQWETIANRPKAKWIHYSCIDAENHWLLGGAEASCTINGYSYESCVCGYKRNEEVLVLLGHDLAQWDTIKEATCAEKGAKRRTCSRCDYSETAEIAALGHDLSQWELTKEATCTEHGEKIRSCSRCDFVENQVVYAPGHTEVIDAGIAATCTEDGITEGKHCSACSEILVAQEVIPALGHDFAAVDDGVVCDACGETVILRILQKHVLMDLQTAQRLQLPLEVFPAHLTADVRWTIEGDEGIVSVDQNGTVTALDVGMVYMVAALTYDEFELTTRCRVDVIDSARIVGIQLNKTAVTAELYSTDYAELEILLQLPQNNQFAAMGMEDAEQNLGIAIESARFENETMAELFEIRVMDDRNVIIVPTDYAVNNPKSVTGKYTGKMVVTVLGEEFTSENLTLTVKKTLPKLKATVPAFNSFYSGQSQQITITGGTATKFYPNPAQKAALPNWLNLAEDGTLTLNEKAPLKNASAKAYILVDTAEWRIPAAVTVSVKNTYKARGLKLSASSVTFTTIAENSNGIAMKLLCTGKNETLADLKVTGITAPAGYVVENFNVADGSFTLKALSGFKAGAINLGVQFRDTAVEQPLKLTVKTAKVTLKASSTKVTLNISRNDSAVIDITATPADYQITDPVITLTGTETINKKKVTVDKLNSGELDVAFEDGKLRIATTSTTPDEASYKLSISAGGSKTVTITINTVSTVPTVTYKTTGSMDLSFPNQTATITPTFKNCGNGFDKFECTVAEMKGKTVVNENVTNAFEVTRDGNALKVRCIDESVNISNTYALKLKLILEDGSSVENTISLKVKRTAVKLKLSITKLTLNKLIGDKASVDVSCTTKGYDFTEPVLELKDSKNKDATGQLNISFNNGKLNIATNDATVYGTSYKVLVKANDYAPASTLTVSIPKADESAVTATVKAAGSIDVVRDGSVITLTPTYKNVTAQTKKIETLVFYKTANKVTTEVNELFAYTFNPNGTITVKKAEGAALDHSAKYTVKLVTDVNGSQICESKPISISVKMGATKLTLKANDTMLFAQDKHDRVVFRFDSADKALNEVVKIEIKDAKYKDMFEILDYGNGEFAIGFKDSNVSEKLIGKKASLDVTLNLNVFIDGNQTTKANTTAKIELTIVK